MGRVYAAQHVLMRKRVAIKILHRELTGVAEVVARFEREAMAAANIDHPNVAAATDFGRMADGAVFMVMEYVEGTNLRDEIAAGPLAPLRAARVARQIASALASAHAQGIVHRDLKPENVMLVSKGTEADLVKVLDFGIARVPIAEDASFSAKPLTKAGMVFGTPEYMAPEQALGQHVDGRADLYALGVILYEMLAGVRPFVASTQNGIVGQQLSRVAPPLAERAPGLAVPVALEQVTMRLLERDVSARYAGAAELVGAIDAALGGMASEAARVFTRFGGTGAAPLDPSAANEGVPGSAAGRDAEGGASGDVALARAGVGLSAGDGVAIPRPAAALAAPPPALRFVAKWLDWIDRRRLRLPRPWCGIPAPFYLGGGGALGLALTLAVVTLLPSPLAAPVRLGTAVPSSAFIGDAPAPELSARDPRPLPSAELEVAVRGGASALVSLAERYPRQAPVRLALAQAALADGRLADAVAALGTALELDPAVAASAEAATVLRRAVADAATRDAAFALLKGPMGEPGSELVYSLAVSDAVPAETRRLAEAQLRDPSFLGRASPALGVLLRLRAARTCSEVAAVLDAARTDGDARALRYLHAYTETKSCKVKRRRTDCWPCLRGDDRLHRAIAAIAARKAEANAAP